MSLSLNATDFGTLDQAITASSLIKQNIAQLTAETSSGFLASDYAGLGDAAGTALDLAAEIAGNKTLQDNADAANTIQTVAQTALNQIVSIANNFAGQATTLETTPASAGTVAASAQDALQQVGELLDTKVGDVYVFAGQDSADPPVPDPANLSQSAFAQAIQTAIAGLTTNGATATIASTLAIAAPGGTSPFSATLDASGVQSEVDLGDGARVALAPLANTNSNATSTGAGVSSTGSYTRDLLMGLATLASLGQVDTSDPNYLQLVQSTVTTLQGASTAASTDIGALGDRQDQVTSAKTDISGVTVALQTQLSSAQGADLAQVAAQLSAAQTQLQASYQVIAGLSQLSLAKYL
jgi:flagellar hook-associated protein 3 FlgL